MGVKEYVTDIVIEVDDERDVLPEELCKDVGVVVGTIEKLGLDDMVGTISM